MLCTACALLEGSLSQWDLSWWQNVVGCHHGEVMTWHMPAAVRAVVSGCSKHEVTAVCFLLRYPARPVSSAALGGVLGVQGGG